MVPLDRILEAKRLEIDRLRARAADLGARAADAPPPRDLLGRLRRRAGAGDLAIIAEAKRAAPSAGRFGVEPLEAVAAYATEADALSILTDRHFEASIDDLAAVRAATDLPILRKDFILDEIQVREARAAGADAVLLIADILDAPRLGDLRGLAASLGMAVLVEVVREEALERVPADADLVGVNARDLLSPAYEVDLGRVARLAPRLPPAAFVVAESGVLGPADLGRAYAPARPFEGLLVGGGLLRTLAAGGDAAGAIRDLRAAYRRLRAAG